MLGKPLEEPTLGPEWRSMSNEASFMHPQVSPSVEHYGLNRYGKNLFGNSVIAIDARTGEYKWHFQAVHHDIWDYDLASTPTLATFEHEGQLRDAVVQVTKMGHAFVLDRDTGEPIFPVEERPVPQSELPGEQTWPTQPFPTKPPAYARQGFRETDITDLNPEAHAFREGNVFRQMGALCFVSTTQPEGRVFTFLSLTADPTGGALLLMRLQGCSS